MVKMEETNHLSTKKLWHKSDSKFQGQPQIEGKFHKPSVPDFLEEQLEGWGHLYITAHEMG